MHHKVLWAWIANSWRLRGFDDDRCIREACRAVTDYLAAKYETSLEHVPMTRKYGPRPITTDAIPSKYRARAALRDMLSASKKRGRGGGGE
jgi:hypothetical protein